MADNAATGAQLNTVRRRIDRLDEQILRLVNTRARLALVIGRIKKQRKWPVYDMRRETFVLNHVRQANRGPLPAGAVRRIFQTILTQCRRSEHRGNR